MAFYLPAGCSGRMGPTEVPVARRHRCQRCHRAPPLFTALNHSRQDVGSPRVWPPVPVRSDRAALGQVLRGSQFLRTPLPPSIGADTASAAWSSADTADPAAGVAACVRPARLTAPARRGL
jgi:hypothetical protein